VTLSQANGMEDSTGVESWRGLLSDGETEATALE
jgi:hypothetical protein